MQIDLNVTIKDTDHTARHCVKQVLLSEIVVEKGKIVEKAQLSGEEKYKRYQLANKIDVDGEVDLTIDELSTIKSLVGAGFSVYVVGSIWDILEGSND